MVKLLIEWFKAKNIYQRSSDSNILKRDDKCGKDLSWWNCNNFGKALAHGLPMAWAIPIWALVEWASEVGLMGLPWAFLMGLHWANKI